ncbi:AAA domain-containing protein [uncultured Sphingomonas sp.]|uniref:DEAD/DEAH box helicase n=1 Tax=uncultured Sphingomonas sp. TaxID=158754 RepID=UPI0035CB4846
MARLRGKGGHTRPLDDYGLDEQWWQVGDTASARPFVGGATFRPSDTPVVVKQWPRRIGSDDAVLREIWHDEVRQLNRLKGMPRASGLLATLRDSFEDEHAFTLILDCGDRVPLAVGLASRRGRSWYASPRGAVSRLRLWHEVSRLAEAIGILHGQGLLHRNIDAWAVMTDGGEDPDFLLTGFEWSMRLAAAPPAHSRKPRSTVHSFYEDWRALGNLVALILDIESASGPREPYRADPAANIDFLSGPERDLLRTLVAADPIARLDCDVVSDHVRRILPALEQQRLGTEPKLMLALQLDAERDLSKQIRAASGNTVALGDYPAQLAFISEALLDQPRLVKTSGHDGREGYRIVCNRLNLAVRPFTNPRTQEQSWTMAQCGLLERDRPPMAQIKGSASLEGLHIEVITLGEARRRAPRLQGRTTRWDELIVVEPLDPLVASMRSNTRYAAAMLVQVVDMLWRATQIWPVRRVSLDMSGTEAVLVLEGREDRTLSALASAMDLAAPAARLRSGILGETIRLDGEWQLSNELAVGRVRGGRTTTWRFSEVQNSGTSTRYVFRAPRNRAGLDLEHDLYLRLGGAGDDALSERRLNALRILRDHTELLDVLADPAGGIRPSRDDPAVVEDLRGDLDDSKFDALRGAWDQLPLYLVQGPPGVGKTRLVEALVERRLGSAPMDRLLLSAQSHSAVDHLLVEVKEALAELPAESSEQIFPLRCRPLEAEARSEWDREAQARRIATSLCGSDLVKAASPSLRRKVQQLSELYSSAAEGGDEDGDGEVSRVDRSFESLLLRSANLVFASINSGDLARLLEERGRFDWSMVEEAGKATGVELLTPLMLSHRRLLIGDHQQLPAFEADRLKELLASPASVRKALVAGNQIIAPLFRKLELEEALDTLGETVDERTCAAAVEMLLLFESLIVPHVLSGARDQAGRTIGKQLLEQHRMHPVLGSMISDVFYEGALRTYPPAAERFKKPAPLLSVSPSLLPDDPLVFIDLDYAPDVVGMRSPERQPRWTNPAEVDAALRVLSLLEVVEGKHPSLAVLSPYRRQVVALEKAIAEREQGLANLVGFKPKLEGWCGTVDSFQGDQADCVVVSLVRNNGRTGIGALGFLADERRLNVLLSRARWKLVVIGSLNFLRAAAPRGEGPSFLDRFLDFVEPPSGEQIPGVAIVPMSKLSGCSA